MADHVLVELNVFRKDDGAVDLAGLRLLLGLGEHANVILVVPGDDGTLGMMKVRAWLQENRIEEPNYVFVRTPEMLAHVVRTLRLRVTWAVTSDPELATEALALGIGVLLAARPVLAHPDLGAERPKRAWASVEAELERQRRVRAGVEETLL